MGCHDQQPLHILFFPVMAPGHMLPMVDMARAFTARGLTSTILTTPGNASLLQSLVDKNSIQLSFIPFPHVDGLPDGCENLSSLPVDMHGRFFAALASLREPFDDALKRIRPDCIVSDSFLPWTADSAADIGIPRLVYQPSYFFVQCVLHNMMKHKPMDSLPDEQASFVIPGLPHRIEMQRSMMLDVRRVPFFLEMFRKIEASESKTFGTLMNSFYELEPEYADYFRHVMGRKAWSVGPIFLCHNKEEVDNSQSEHWCLKWLDEQRPRSVVYVCFGSLADMSSGQLRELALGLESSNRPFLWVVRAKGDEWMPEGLEKRIEETGRGLIVRGWAPQMLILKHDSVGGFVTHCGASSCLEGISAGLPLVTWPLFADQFYNERLIVDVLKTGVPVGMTVHTMKAEEREIIEAARIEAAINELMGDEKGAKERRENARVVGELARRAVEKGGSSYNDIDNLIAELIERKATNE